MENDNNYYTQPDGQYGNQTYGQADGQYGNQAYGQYGNQAYGEPNGQYGNQAYGQPNQQFGYNQNMGYGMGMPSLGDNGQPLENRFAMKLTFSILEILCCCAGNLVTMIMGIIGCVFTAKANTSFKEGRWEEFKSEAKTSAICLWIGLGFFVVGMIGTILLWAAGLGEAFKEGFREGYYGTEDVYVFVDGTCIDIPMDYDDLEELGFHLQRDDVDEMLEADGDYGLYQLVNDDGDEVMWCWFCNDTSRDAYLEDCEVIGVDVDYYCENYEIYRTSEGLGFSSTKEEFIDTYGRPDDTYYDGESEQLCWYLGDGEDPVWQVMEVTFVDGELYDIDIDYRN